MKSDKSVMARWVQGMKDLTVVQQLKSQLIGYAGGIVGIIFAWFFLVKMGFWFFSILLFFSVFLQAISFIGTYQKWVQAVETEKIIENQKKEIEKLMEGEGNGF